MDFVRTLWAILPPAFFWGASFPLALASACRHRAEFRAARGRRLRGEHHRRRRRRAPGEPAARRVDRIAAGAASDDADVDACGRGGARIRSLGSPGRFRGRRSAGRRWRSSTGALLAGVPPVPGLLIAYGRFTATVQGQAGEILYSGEGLHSSVAVSRLPNGRLGYHNAGKIQASSEPQDMRLQRMLGHLTTLVPKQARSVLVIGCGAGVTAGAVSIDPRVERVTIAEIEPLVPRVVSKYFGDGEPPRHRQPEGARPDRRRAALPADVEGEVRRHHVGSARPVGQGRGDALHEGVLRGGQGPSQPGRRRHAVRAAVREHAGGREERDGDVLHGVPGRHHRRQHVSGDRLRHRAARAGRARRGSTSTRSTRA